MVENLLLHKFIVWSLASVQITLFLLLSYFLFYTSSTAENISVHKSSQGANWAKHFLNITTKQETPTQVGNEHPSIPFLLHRPLLFHLSADKKKPIPSKMEIRAPISGPTNF